MSESQNEGTFDPSAWRSTATKEELASVRRAYAEEEATSEPRVARDPWYAQQTNILHADHRRMEEAIHLKGWLKLNLVLAVCLTLASSCSYSCAKSTAQDVRRIHAGVR